LISTTRTLETTIPGRPQSSSTEACSSTEGGPWTERWCPPRGRWAFAAAAGAVFLLVQGLVAASPAAADDKFAAEFLKIGIGARPMGMGGSFVSIADDATAGYWNPAGLVQLRGREAMLMHASQFGGQLADNYGSVAIPLGNEERNSAVGVSVIWLSVDDIQVTTGLQVDDQGNPIYDESRIRYDSAYDLGLLLSYARPFGDRWSGGVNLKLIRQSLVDAGSSFGIGADLGILFQPRPGWGIGLEMDDITTTQLHWDSGRRETVSPTFTLGAHTTQGIPSLNGTITLGADAAMDLEGQEGDQFGFLPGMEYWYRQTVALRVGADQGSLTAGAGVRYKQFGVDYAYLDHEDLDSSHRISALFRF